MGINLVVKSLMNRDAEQQRIIKDLSERLRFAEAEIDRLEGDIKHYKKRLNEGKGE